MAVTTTVRSVTYAGDGATNSWSVGFRVLAKADLVLTRIAASGAETAVGQSDFDFAPLSDGGGTVTYPIGSDLPSGVHLRIERVVSLKQPTEFANQGGYFARAMENAADRLAMADQQQQAALDRSLKTAVGAEPIADIPNVATRAGMLFAWDEDGQPSVADIDDFRGQPGPPGGSAADVGLWSDIPDMSIGEEIDRISVRGRVRVGDPAAGKFLSRRIATDPTPANPDGVVVALDSDVADADGHYWRWEDGQAFCPEMFADDAQADALAAFTAMHDLVNYYGGGRCHGQPGAVYSFPNAYVTVGAFTSRSFRRRDGRTVTYPAPAKAVGVARDPHLACVDFYEFDGRGCRLVMDGAFNLTAADYANGYRKRDTRTVFEVWKSRNVALKDFSWDGQWRLQTTDTGAAGECYSYFSRWTGCAHVRWENLYLHDGAQDAAAMAHRNRASLDGIALATTESYPEPDQSTAEVYDPAGIMWDVVIRNCVIDGFRRQGLSPVGVGFKDLEHDLPGLTVENTTIRNIGRYAGTAPRWPAGGVTDGSIKWQWRGFPPRLALDFEPVRVSGYQVGDVFLSNVHMLNCIGGFVGAVGSWGRTRVEQSIAASAVNVAANSFTRAGLTLPRVRPGGIPPKIRVWSDGTLPGGLQACTDYYLIKLSTTDWKLAVSPEKALVGTAIDITSQGSGNHWFAWVDTPPNVGKITMRGCVGVHPPDGSLLPFQVSCELLDVQGCSLHNASGTALFGPNAVYRERQVFRGNRMSFVRLALDVDSYNALKTQDLALSGFDADTDVLTLMKLNPDPVDALAHPIVPSDDGLGKYEYVPVKVRSTIALPAPLKELTTYWMTRTGANTRKFSYTEQDARNGAYIDFTSTGSGVFTYYRDAGSEYDFSGNTFVQQARYLEFDGATDVDLATGAIAIPMPDRQEGTAVGEHFKIVPVTTDAVIPTGWDDDTTYYAFQAYDDPAHVYLAATSPAATAQTAVKPTALGSGRLRLAQTNTTHMLDLLDSNCSFHGNRLSVDATCMEPVTATLVNVAGVTDYGGNVYETNLTGAGFHRAAYARTPGGGAADTFRGNFQSTGLTGFQTLTTRALSTTLTLTPTVSIAAGTHGQETLAVAGALAGDAGAFTPPAFVAGLLPLSWKSAADGQVTLHWANTSAGPLTPGAGSYTLTGVRTK